jgi:hypothetical protein
VICLGKICTARRYPMTLQRHWPEVAKMLVKAKGWSLAAQVVEVEGHRAVDALRRSGELVRGRWLKVASLVGVGTAVAIAAGPLLGALLILLTDAPLALLNIVAGVVYALTMPFVALVTAYMYFDARTQHELEPADEPDELPAEIEVRPAT